MCHLDLLWLPIFAFLSAWGIYLLCTMPKLPSTQDDLVDQQDDIIDPQTKMVEEYAEQLADEDIEKEKQHNEQMEKKKKEHELAQKKCPRCKSWQVINNIRPSNQLPREQVIHVCKKCKNERIVQPLYSSTYRKKSVKEHIQDIIRSAINEPCYHYQHRERIKNNNIKKSTLLHLCDKYNLLVAKGVINDKWCICK